MTPEHIARLNSLGVDLNAIQMLEPCKCGCGDLLLYLEVFSVEWCVSCQCGMTGPTATSERGAALGWNDFISTFRPVRKAKSNYSHISGPAQLRTRP